MNTVLNEEHKNQYSSLLKSAHDLENTIGATQYRLYKLTVMREDIDKGIKMWWDRMLSEYTLNPKHDYMITNDGEIEDVTKADVVEPVKSPEAPVYAKVSDLV